MSSADVPQAATPAGAPSTTDSESTDGHVAARALEILREWMDEPEPETDDLMPQAERVKAADAARVST